jgi:uncharacterized protein (TIGR02757 family)
MAEKLNIASKNELSALKPFLDASGEKVEQESFIEEDPVQFMHAYQEKEDQLLAGFFAALMAWGRRDVVISKVDDLLKRMEYQPSAFIKNFSEADRKAFEGFKHRTFKPVDIYWLAKILNGIETKFNGFEDFWSHCYRLSMLQERPLMSIFPEEFFKIHPEAAQRTRKHISDASRNSSCKRLCLFLKWSIRKGSPVDLGIMDFMSTSELMIPLDVHVGRQARRLGLLNRKYNDWKAVVELTHKLKYLDPKDPAKYDFALFGLGTGHVDIPPELVKNPNMAKEGLQ